jgi:hypothetical protein
MTALQCLDSDDIGSVPDLNDASLSRMLTFDAPLHGKHMNLRDFSDRYETLSKTDDTVADDGRSDLRQRIALWHALPACVTLTMTIVHGLETGTTEWGPETGLLHFFLSVFLPLLIYTLMCLPEKGVVV